MIIDLRVSSCQDFNSSHVSARILTRQDCASFVHLFPFTEQILVVLIDSYRNGKNFLQGIVCKMLSKDHRSIKYVINQVMS